MADRPSRGLVFYGDGSARFLHSLHNINTNHLSSFASLASCGFLSLPNSPPSESEQERIVREFAELLDACEDYTKFTNEEAWDKKSSMLTISERFMGIRAAIFTSNSSVKSLGIKLGFTILQSNELRDNNNSFSESLLQNLGFVEGKILETNKFDLVFVHFGYQEEINGQNSIEYIDALLGEILETVQPGSEIASRLHTSIVLSYGVVTEDDDPRLLVLDPNPTTDNNCAISSLFPRQSYTVKGGNPRKNVRHYSPMLVAQFQSGVTRRDIVNKFSFKDFREFGANLTIPADRFIHEIAFKLWKAPKYGA